MKYISFHTLWTGHSVYGGSHYHVFAEATIYWDSKLPHTELVQKYREALGTMIKLPKPKGTRKSNGIIVKVNLESENTQLKEVASKLRTW